MGGFPRQNINLHRFFVFWPKDKKNNYLLVWRRFFFSLGRDLLCELTRPGVMHYSFSCGTIRSTLSLSCLTLCLQQSFTVDLLLIRCHTFLNSNPIIQEILFRKFGVNRLNSLWVIPSSASLLSSCPAAMTRWISWWRHSFPPQPVLINSNHGGSHLFDCRPWW